MEGRLVVVSDIEELERRKERLHDYYKYSSAGQDLFACQLVEDMLAALKERDEEIEKRKLQFSQVVELGQATHDDNARLRAAIERSIDILSLFASKRVQDAMTTLRKALEK